MEHPLWPALFEAQDRYHGLLARIRESLGNPSAGDEVRSMIGEARAIAQECQNLALTMLPQLSENERMVIRNSKIALNSVDEASRSDLDQLLANRLSTLDALARVEAQIRKSGRLKTVPWGGIRSHERDGRHLIQEHVGKSIAELHQQLTTKPSQSQYASTFPDVATADKAAAQVLTNNHWRIADWLRSGTRTPLTAAYDCGDVVGYVLERGTHRYFPTSKVKLILVRNPDTLLGYQVKTGFPIP